MCTPSWVWTGLRVTAMPGYSAAGCGASAGAWGGASTFTARAGVVRAAAEGHCGCRGGLAPAASFRGRELVWSRADKMSSVPPPSFVHSDPMSCYTNRLCARPTGVTPIVFPLARRLLARPARRRNSSGPSGRLRAGCRGGGGGGTVRCAEIGLFSTRFPRWP